MMQTAVMHAPSCGLQRHAALHTQQRSPHRSLASAPPPQPSQPLCRSAGNRIDVAALASSGLTSSESSLLGPSVESSSLDGEELHEVPSLADVPLTSEVRDWWACWLAASLHF